MSVFDKNTATSTSEAEEITPRAEFRVFGQGIIDIVRLAMWKAQAKLFKIRQSEEIYILSSQTNDANVKIRDGLLDIKIKVGETDEGYEIFQPRGKFSFPANKEDLLTIFENLLVQISAEQSTYTLEEFLTLVDESRELTAVSVEKERYGFSVDGVICEYAEVLFNGALVETACAESTDYTAIENVINTLEIAEFENTNYLKAAKQVIGMS
ncbi:MAG: hypothetical protein HKP41_00450 [Desulfobacterales bacterium]|nr:hypothetical protein [Desulfobacterales bacterium]